MRFYDRHNEIDLVAMDEAEHVLIIGEVKRNPNRISMPLLERKAAKIRTKFKTWTIRYVGLSMEEMGELRIEK